MADDTNKPASSTPPASSEKEVIPSADERRASHIAKQEKLTASREASRPDYSGKISQKDLKLLPTAAIRAIGRDRGYDLPVAGKSRTVALFLEAQGK